MIVKIVDPTDEHLDTLEFKTFKVLTELNVVGTIEKYKSLDKVSKYNIQDTPAFIVNDKIKVSGKVPPKEEIKKLLQEENKIAG